MARPIPVLLDVDTGIDDALAILLALRSPEIVVVGVTCVAGKVRLPLVVRDSRSILLPSPAKRGRGWGWGWGWGSTGNATALVAEARSLVRHDPGAGRINCPNEFRFPCAIEVIRGRFRRAVAVAAPLSRGGVWSAGILARSGMLGDVRADVGPWPWPHRSPGVGSGPRATASPPGCWVTCGLTLGTRTGRAGFQPAPPRGCRPDLLPSPARRGRGRGWGRSAARVSPGSASLSRRGGGLGPRASLPAGMVPVAPNGYVAERVDADRLVTRFRERLGLVSR